MHFQLHSRLDKLFEKFEGELETTSKSIWIQLTNFVCVNQQDELNSDLDLSEARASLLSGDVVELINATAVDSTSMKLLWEVREPTDEEINEKNSPNSLYNLNI